MTSDERDREYSRTSYCPNGYELHNILQLVKTDPEWAANVIQQYERTYAELVEGNKRLKEDYERLWETYQAACATIKNRESIIKAMDATFLGEGEE